MPVKIEIINKIIDENNNEYKAALVLKAMMENSFSKATNGTIGIAYGLTLCGQEVRDIDILMFGKLDNYFLSNYYTNNPIYHKKNLKVDGFCIAIELKEHTSDRVVINNTHVHVEYNGSWKDATVQNEKQRYSCASYLENVLGYKVYTANFLWLKSLTKAQLVSMTGGNSIGALSAEFKFTDVIDVLINQGLTPYYDNSDKCYHINANYDNDFFTDIKKSLFMDKVPVSNLTKKKLETLIQNRVNNQLLKNKIGGELTVLKGRAGTGKTFHLIQSALNLANAEQGNRCIILTYNHALVSDIRRLLHFLEIPDGIDNYTIQIQTLHSFFMQLMRTLNISTAKITGSFFDCEYKKSLEELLSYVTEIMDENDIRTLKEKNDIAIDWDYVLIDEAQDWLDSEKNILFKIYGEDRIIVADGVDQFMRGNKYQHWVSKKRQSQQISLEVGMRQKTNLINFVNTFASRMGVKWRVKSTSLEQWAGGKIIVMDNYDSTTHAQLLQECKKAGGDSYDMLFLVPFQMAPHTTNVRNDITPISIDTWREAGISLFDGTNMNREQYSTNIDECRLYQYDSCRGLEGWATVCFKFDILIDNKLKLAKQMGFEEELELRSRKEQEQEYAYRWSLMPLTRAIDTLVITLHDSNSNIGQMLKEMALGEFKDFMSWKCK